MIQTKICPNCGMEFRKLSKFCTAKCYYEAIRKGIVKSGFQKGYTPFNKGLTRETSEIVDKMYLNNPGNKGCHQSDYQKLIASQTHKNKKLTIAQKLVMYHSKEYDPEWYKSVVAAIHNGNPSGRAKKAWLTKHENGTEVLCSYGIAGYRSDLKRVYFRSSWEANYARILDYLHIEWLFEPVRFKLRDCSYLPDFYLPEYGCYVEISGRFANEKVAKLRQFSELYPDLPLYVIRSDGYTMLKNKFFSKIPQWEFSGSRKGVMPKCA